MNTPSFCSRSPSAGSPSSTKTSFLGARVLPSYSTTASSPPLVARESGEDEHKSSSSLVSEKELAKFGEDNLNEMLQQFKRRSADMRIALLFVTIGFLVMLGAFLGAVVFAIHLLKSNSEHLATDTNIPQAQRNFAAGPGIVEYIGLDDLNRIPLDAIDQMHSLSLRWNTNGKEEQRLYNIISAERNDEETVVHLSQGHKLLNKKDKAILFDEDNKEIGVVQFPSTAGDASPQASPLTSLIPQRTGSLDASGTLGPDAKARHLLFGLKKAKFNREPTDGNLGNPDTLFEAYCRYGCGKLAVTFPYYYRPFFGYGYPLVGTEGLFPQGYGGYPGASALTQYAQAGPLTAQSRPPGTI